MLHPQGRGNHYYHLKIVPGECLIDEANRSIWISISSCKQENMNLDIDINDQIIEDQKLLRGYLLEAVFINALTVGFQIPKDRQQRHYSRVDQVEREDIPEQEGYVLDVILSPSAGYHLFDLLQSDYNLNGYTSQFHCLLYRISLGQHATTDVAPSALKRSSSLPSPSIVACALLSPIIQRLPTRLVGMGNRVSVRTRRE